MSAIWFVTVVSSAFVFVNAVFFVLIDTWVSRENSTKSRLACSSAAVVSEMVREKSPMITSSMPKMPVLADCEPV